MSDIISTQCPKLLTFLKSVAGSGESLDGPPGFGPQDEAAGWDLLRRAALLQHRKDPLAQAVLALDTWYASRTSWTPPPASKQVPSQRLTGALRRVSHLINTWEAHGADPSRTAYRGIAAEEIAEARVLVAGAVAVRELWGNTCSVQRGAQVKAELAAYCRRWLRAPAEPSAAQASTTTPASFVRRYTEPGHRDHGQIRSPSGVM